MATVLAWMLEPSLPGDVLFSLNATNFWHSRYNTASARSKKSAADMPLDFLLFLFPLAFDFLGVWLGDYQCLEACPDRHVAALALPDLY